jgi:hypothetical protein
LIDGMFWQQLLMREIRLNHERLTMKATALIFIVALTFVSLPAKAETIDVDDNHGGRVNVYNARWADLAKRGVNVRIVGPCQSACTVLLGHIPRKRICVTPQARFGFHLAHLSQATTTLWNAYAPDIKAWIKAHGGLQKDFVWMGAPDIFRYFHKC